MKMWNLIKSESVSAVIPDWIAGPCFSGPFQDIGKSLIGRPDQKSRFCYKYRVTAEMKAMQSLDIFRSMTFAILM